MRIIATLVAFSVVALGANSSTVTFYKDVAPILEKDCQNCHRPGQIAPMSFLTYESVRPWARELCELQ